MTVHIEKSRKSSRRHKRLLAGSAKQALSFELLESRQLLAGLTVTNATDLINADTSSISALVANDGGDGVSLREAIEATNNTTGADTITFDGSVFTGGAASLVRLTQGELEIAASLTIDASSATDVVISGDANGDDVTLDGTFITEVADITVRFPGLSGDNSRVLNFTGEIGDLTLAGLTLTGGYHSGESNAAGGGINFESSGTLTLNQSNVSGNGVRGLADRSFSRGGGIFSRPGNISINNSTVSGNRNFGGYALGGGIFASSVSLANSTVSGNSLFASYDFGYGGGVFGYDVTLVNSTISDNFLNADNGATGHRGNRGGGISAFGGVVSLTNSTVSGNTADGDSYGGGVFSSGQILLDNSTITNNSASEGGGVFTGFGTLSLVNSTLSGNTADTGGGVHLDVNGSVSLTNSTISGNTASDEGGGVFIVAETLSSVSEPESEPQTVSLVNSTITGNSSGEGGGISIGVPFFAGDTTPVNLTITNSIVAGNSDVGSAPDLNAPSDVVSSLVVERSLIGNTSGSGITATSGTGNILNQSALLGPLADNGGSTLTHALLPGSPAIDAGNNALAVDENGIPLTTDQRGETRVQSGTVDIGAVESESAFLLGDANLDGAVNFLDIVPFISLLSNDSFLDEADIDRNGDVDFLDITPFISLLSSGGSALGSKSVAPAISSASAVRSEVGVVDLADSPAGPLVLVSKPASVAVASSVEVPLTTETSLVKTVAANPAPVSPKVGLVKPQPQAPLVLVNDSSVSAAVETSQLAVVDAQVFGATPEDRFIGPVADSFLGIRNLSLEGSESNGPLLTRRFLAGSVERIDLPDESRDTHSTAIVSSEQPFATAAELFDAHPESLDQVFDFELEETFVGLIQ